MAEKTQQKKCKYCQSDIPVKAKICPVCNKKQGMKVWQIALIVFVVLGVLGTMVGTEGDKNSNVSNAINSDSKDIKTSKLELVGGIDGTTTTGDSFSTYIKGTVQNNTNKDYSYVQITFNLYDSDGAKVGTAMDNIGGLGKGEVWKFKAIALEKFSSYRLDDITGW